VEDWKPDRVEERKREVEHLLGAIDDSLARGGAFLASRRAPYGPIMRERNLDYIHKATWGMYAAGVDEAIIGQLLTWAGEALQENGDFYFPEEEPEYRIMQRAYRPLTFGKVAAWLDHPLIHRQEVVERLLQYQHQGSGGCFNYIGEDPNDVEEQPTIGSLNTTFFGHLMVALDRRDEAIAAGNWCRRFVEANREFMARNGVMYTQMDLQGEVITDVGPGESYVKTLNNRGAKQEFWQTGTTEAYLAVLYEAMRDEWGFSDAEAQPYLDDALTLLEFDDTMPLETYLWFSKCKVGWGAGELLRILTRYRMGTWEQVERAYRVARKVAIFTFIDNQLPTGGYSCMHYPLDERIPEMAFEYKPLGGTVNVPDSRLEGTKTIFLPSEEITGEFLGEMGTIKAGMETLLEHYRSVAP